MSMVADERPVLEHADDGDEAASTVWTGRRRRPTGEPPPLPAEQRWRGIRWVLVAAAAAAVSLTLFVYLEPGSVQHLDESLSSGAVGLRNPALLRVAETADVLTQRWVLRVVLWATIAVLVAFRRFRFLGALLLAVFLAEWGAQAMNFAIQRPRPDVEILGSWQGFSHPSRPVAALAVTLLGALRVLAPHGPVRRIGAVAIGLLLATVGFARVLLGIDHASDVVIAAAIGAGIVFGVTRLLVPHERHPVVYRLGESAHLPLDQVRRDAIRTAMDAQLGMRVQSVELFGAEGSAGSTPLRITLDPQDDGPDEVFAKLLARQHLRSDRTYKFVRLLQHGKLENESPFTTVRQLVEYEDHMTRVLRDAGVRVPRSHGVVELTPEREYLIVFDRVDGQDFDVTAEASDTLLDNALGVVRDLWVAGMAHRDIKPGNLLVDGDEITLIDVAFAQMRPTPWRQAVDLGTMLLLLALAAGPERVHARAIEIFSPEEIAEALAATDGFAIPRQLRTLLDADEWRSRDALCALVPHRDPIRVTRWGAPRLRALAITVVAVALGGWIAWAALDTVDLL